MPYVVFAASEVAFGLVAALAFIGAAALIWWRRSRSTFAIFVIVALLLRSPGFVSELDLLPGRVATWEGPTLAVRCLDAVTALLFLFVFPTGSFVPPATRVVAAVWAAWVFGTLATPEINPALSVQEPWAALIVTALAIGGLAAQIHRYRVADTERERLQMRWVLYGLAVYVVVFAAQQLVPVLAPVVRSAGAERFWYRLVGDAAIDLAALLVPLTIAVAILKARLLDIDLIINRTLVYVVATMILAGAFAGLSTGAQFVVGEVTGHGSDALSIVIAIGVGAFFAPLRSIVQRAVDARLRPRPAAGP